ncbi:MAG: hypothetical protein JXA20_05530 [Spirochaetes bacterium]|nr:hypothetical protein [Spirochaetota bacterium]
MRNKPTLKVNVLVYKKGKTWFAHCLEMDILTSGTSEIEVKDDIISLVKAQLSYAFSNDNLENLFKFAPVEDWQKLEKVTNCEERFDVVDLSSPSTGRKKTKITHPLPDLETCFAL